MSLPVKKVLVTAGTRGLGAEISRLFARNGCDVAFTYKENTDAAHDLVKELEGMGRNIIALQADAKDFSRAGEVVDEVVKTWGGLDVLVCSAGVAASAPLYEMTEKQWDDVVDVSLKGSFNYVQAVSKPMMANRAGKIVCIGSINGLRGRMGTISYNVAKAGLVGLVKTAASELGRYHINVNLVAPGFIETTSQASTPELIRDLVLKECAIPRLGQPEDIAPLVTFLASDDANHITGQTIKVDAGQYL